MDANGALSLAFDPVLNALRVTGGVGGGATVSDAVYNEATWNGDTTNAASKNALRDKFESLPQIAADDPTELDFTTLGTVTTATILATIARQSDLDTTNAFISALLAELPLRSRLTAATTPVNASTVPVDSGLTVEVAANQAYMVESFIPYQTAQAADLSISWVSPAGVSGWWTVGGMGLLTTATEAVIKRGAVSWATAGTVGGHGTATSSRVSAEPKGLLVVGGTAGTFKMQFCQQTSDASDTIIAAHAWMKLTPIA